MGVLDVPATALAVQTYDEDSAGTTKVFNFPPPCCKMSNEKY